MIAPQDFNSPEQSFAGRAYLAYAGLHQLAAQAGWPMVSDGAGGQLCGLFAVAMLDASTSVFPAAASVAGAASLTITPDAEASRELLRNGLCDFVVNSLDEALRILKNELRKRQPVSVCVSGATAAIVAEMQERGVAPNVQVDSSGAAWPGEVLLSVRHARGSLHVGGRASSTGLQMVSWRGPVREQLRNMVLGLLPIEDRLRRRWVEASVRFLPRQVAGASVCEMSLGEREALVDAVTSRLMIGELTGPVEIAFAGEVVVLGGSA